VVSVKFDSTTPAPPAPSNLVATRLDASTVRLEWTASPGASSYRIWRDGQRIASSVGATSFDDAALPDGSHAYAVQSVVDRIGAPALESARSTEVRIRTGAFTVVVVGDSVTWGQGLSDEHKYTGKVKQWLETNLGIDVRLLMLAHSGANILPPADSDPSNELRVTLGEVPNTFPTILNQIDLAAAQLPAPAQVDLVIVGGCINDVNVRSILNPVNGAEVVNLTASACSTPVTDLLVKANSAFPAARIVLTGYFPLVSNLTDLSGVVPLLAIAGVVTAPGAAALGIPVIDPLTGVISGAILTEVAKTLVAMNSQIFYVGSTLELAAAARTANARIGGKVSFACAPFRAVNAYAAPMSWLWLAPTGPLAHDEVFDQRGAVCGDDEVMTTAGSSPDSLAMDRLQCTEASMGHPNPVGAQIYFDVIREQIEPFLPAWKDRLAPVQPAR
jgi:lysophospholipase L1-like esterase